MLVHTIPMESPHSRGGLPLLAHPASSGPLSNPASHLDSELNSRHITLLTKVCIVKAMVFPVVMYICESWTIKKAEHQRIDAFEMWWWRRLLRVLGLQGNPTSPS